MREYFGYRCYDTDEASRIGGVVVPRAECGEAACTESLFRTRDGSWFIHLQGGGGEEEIWPLPSAAAFQWLLENKGGEETKTRFRLAGQRIRRIFRVRQYGDKLWRIARDASLIARAPASPARLG